ncbi:Uncharacterised protein [Edwardsiella hoshinae]|uniref:Uncharacterized protein n=1 Tax=Edwardsiella hoshinae TaxID=93378 RepID=A0A376D5U6_9GAMM|nr:Uncharacterised protein [Edwardsiella hoshinae]
MFFLIHPISHALHLKPVVEPLRCDEVERDTEALIQ